MKKKRKLNKWNILKCCVCGNPCGKVKDSHLHMVTIGWCEKHIGIESSVSTSALWEIKGILTKYNL